MKTINSIELTNHLFTKQKIVFHNHLAVLIGQHRSGKTTVLTTLFEGFKAKHRDFFVNDHSVNVSDFQVVYLKDHFSLKDEIKLTKTSPFRNHILKNINQNLLNQEKYQKVSAEIQTLALAMESALNDVFANNLNALTHEDIILKFDVHKINLENIIDHLLEIKLFNQKTQTVLEDKNFNHFLARMLIFNVLRSTVDEKDQQRPIIILFDNPEIYTTLKTMQQMNTILRELIQKEQIYLVIASNSVEYLTNLHCRLEHINWLKENTIHHFTNLDVILQEAVGNHAYLTNKEYEDLDKYHSHFNQIFDTHDLQQEWKTFYDINWSYFLTAFFVDCIFLKENTQNILRLQTETNTYRFLGCYQLPLKNLVVLATFYFRFGFAFEINPLVKEKYSKMRKLFEEK